MTTTAPTRLAEPTPPHSGEPPPHRVGRGWFRWGWRTLTSMRTALVLLAMLALAAIPGSVLPQRNVASDPNAVVRFFDEYPQLAPFLDRLQLFNVYSSTWFAAIYILLVVSMTGCVLPRCLKLWRAARTAPPAPPTNLRRLEDHREWDEVPSEASGRAADAVLAAAAQELRRRSFRVVVTDRDVRAERGYSRELGNLLFHLSLLVLLLGLAVGGLFGFEGRVALAEGKGFSNVVSQYDEFNPKALTDTADLEPFTMKLRDFEARFEASGPKRGEPRAFSADVEYSVAGKAPETTTVGTNQPLDVNETKMFLTGHGYAPRITVRDGKGQVAFSGPVIFLPRDTSYASDGVVKVPDAQPDELGFEGFFLPTAVIGEQGPYSAFPDTLNPQLFLTAYTGDLGMSDGVAQSVFTLDKDELDQVRRKDGEPFARALSPGETMRLPNGSGTLTFDGVARFANFQVAYDPGKEISLVAAIALLIGVTMSLLVRRRRIWLRVAPAPRGYRVEAAALSLTRRGTVAGELDAVVTAAQSGGATPTEALHSTSSKDKE